MEFELDPDKSAVNKVKHGVDFIEAQAVWDGQYVEILARLEKGEVRHNVIGMLNGKLRSVIITYRNGKIRIISCRRARPNEKKIYKNLAE